MHFGRLAWSVESDIKWIIDSPDARHFENIEMWAPGRGTCERENRSPDTYFDLTKMYSAAGYEWFAVAALACEIPEPNRRQILLQIHAAFSAVFPNLWSALGHRPWGYDWGKGFGDGMQELSDSVSWNLNKTNGIFNLELLRGKWSLARAA